MTIMCVKAHFENNIPSQSGDAIDKLQGCDSVERVNTCAIKTDGTLWCWGRTEKGEVGIGVNGTDEFRSTPQKVTNP